VDANFFDLGGTSLQLIQVHARIRETMKIDLSLVDLFQYPRIGALAGSLTQRAASPAPGTGVLTAKDRAQRQQAALARARAGSGRNTR
jgi:aryl carrier-like protein